MTFLVKIFGMMNSMMTLAHIGSHLHQTRRLSVMIYITLVPRTLAKLQTLMQKYFKSRTTYHKAWRFRRAFTLCLSLACFIYIY